MQGLGAAGYLSTVQASFHVSTVQGLGQVGYVSSASLTSTIQGLGSAGYLSSVTGTNLPSTVQGLGTAGYVSSASLTSTVQGLGAAGYLSTVQASFHVSTVQGLGQVGYVSSTWLISSIQGLGTSGYISSPNVVVSSISTYSLTSYGATTLNATPKLSRWVAVGANNLAAGTIQYSGDGTTWTNATGSFAGLAGNGIAWNGSKWVAVGDHNALIGSIQSSTDGITWASNTNGGFSNMGYGVAWNGSYWLAVGHNSNSIGSIQKSTDGLTWTSNASGGFCNYGYSAAWNGTMWVATGASSNALATIQFSGDGTNWSNATTGGFATSGYKVAWNGLLWIAVGFTNYTTTGTIQYSYDGMNWTNTTSGGWATEGVGIGWNGTYWLGLGLGGTNIGSIQRSYDGKLWSNNTSGGFSNSGTFTNGGFAAAWSGTMWVAVGGSVTNIGTIQTSTDGLTWTSNTIGGFSTYGRDVAYSCTVTPDISTCNLNFYMQGQPNYLTSTHQIFTTNTSLIMDSVVFVNNANNSVGINTANPQYNLDINGNMQTTGINTQTGIAYPASMFLNTLGNGICYDSQSNLYVAESNLIYKITPAGVKSVFAGKYYNTGPGLDGIGSLATFYSIAQLFYDSYTNSILCPDNNNHLRCINVTTASVITLEQASSPFTTISGVCTDGAGNIYVGDYHSSANRIYRGTFASTTPAANSVTFSVFAGSPTGVSGSINASGTAATFYKPAFLTFNTNNTNLYVSDQGNNLIRKIVVATSTVTTFAGTGTAGLADGPYASATFYQPQGIIMDYNSNLFVLDNTTMQGVNAIYLRCLNTSASYVTTIASNINRSAGITLTPQGTIALPQCNTIAIYNQNNGVFTTIYSSNTSNTYPNYVAPAISTLQMPLAITTGNVVGSGNTLFNSAASFTDINSFSFDSNNMLYVGDHFNIRSVTPNGQVTTLAGNPYNNTSTLIEGIGANATFGSPFGVTPDNKGNVYFVADGGTANYALCKLALSNNRVTVLYSNGTGNTALANPRAIAYDNSNYLYIANYGGTTNTFTGGNILQWSISAGTMSLFKGNTATNVPFSGPASIAITSSNTYLFVGNNLIDTIHIIPVVAGTPPTAGTLSNYITPTNGDPDYIVCTPYNKLIYRNNSTINITNITLPTGTAPSVPFFSNTGKLRGIAVDSLNNVYFGHGASTGVQIKSVSPLSTLTGFVAGNGTANGTDSTYASSINLLAPYVGVNCNMPQYTLDVAGTVNATSLYVAGTVNATSLYGNVLTSNINTQTGFAYPASVFYPTDPYGVSYDTQGNLYMGQRGVIRKTTPQGVISILAGNFGATSVVRDGIGQFATFNAQIGMCYDPYTQGLLVADFTHIRYVNLSTSNVITLDSGSSFVGALDICSDGLGNIYVADVNNHRIMKGTLASTTPTANSIAFTVFAGSATAASGFNDATGTAALFNQPYGICFDATKANLYVSDQLNYRIRKITIPGAVVTTYAGTGVVGLADGPIASATFTAPTGIVMDSNNNFFIYDNASVLNSLYLRCINTTAGYVGTVASNINRAAALSLTPQGNIILPNYTAKSPAIYNQNTGIFTTLYLNNADSNYLTYVAPAISTLQMPLAITTGNVVGSGNTLINSAASFTSPNAFGIDSNNVIYIGDQYNIRTIAQNGQITTIAGNPYNNTSTSIVGIGANASFGSPFGVTPDNKGNVYFVTDGGASSNSGLYKIVLSNNAVSLLFSAASGNTALISPRGMTYDGSNYLYIANLDGVTNTFTGGNILQWSISGNSMVVFSGNTAINTPYIRPCAISINASNNYLFVANYSSAKRNIFSVQIVAGTPPTAGTVSNFISTPINSANYIACTSNNNIFYSQNQYIYKTAINATTPPTGTAPGAPFFSNANLIRIGPVDSLDNIYFYDYTTNILNSVSPLSTLTGFVAGNGTSNGTDSTYASSINLLAPYVGVNCNTPQYTLDVAGSVNASGNVSASGYINTNSTFRSYMQGQSTITSVYSTQGVGYDNIFLQSPNGIGYAPGCTTSIAFGGAFGTGIAYARIFAVDTGSVSGNWQGSIVFQTLYIGGLCNSMRIEGNAKGGLTYIANDLVIAQQDTTTAGSASVLTLCGVYGTTSAAGNASYRFIKGTGPTGGGVNQDSLHLYRNGPSSAYSQPGSGVFEIAPVATANSNAVNPNANQITFYGCVGIGAATTTYQLALSANSAFKPTSSAWTTTSDRRIKKNIVDANLQRCLELVSSINLKYFEWDEVQMSTIVDDKHSLGFIAQEVEEVFPNAIFRTSTFGIDDLMCLNDDQLNKAHFGATKQLITVVDNQQSTIQGQAVQIQTLQTSYDTLISQVSTLMGSPVKIEAP